jgi:hypothetical protein
MSSSRVQTVFTGHLSERRDRAGLGDVVRDRIRARPKPPPASTVLSFTCSGLRPSTRAARLVTVWNCDQPDLGAVGTHFHGAIERSIGACARNGTSYSATMVFDAVLDRFRIRPPLRGKPRRLASSRNCVRNASVDTGFGPAPTRPRARPRPFFTAQK